ncbi:hypothetical protein SAV14893_012960 [Streptomyces avermitilis]|uniref:Uncharacterized protein n=1 Tax=Streptomyces avermitilis TaxID=33903 RepID=A0A4D4LV28_STRAX|nr:hypothetical protein SAV14893_012960 [Streptomyces avermitilis]
MELDLVDPVAPAVVRPQLGRVLVRQGPPLLYLRGAGAEPEPRQLGARLVEERGIEMPLDGLHEGPVGGEDVIAHQGRSLVGHGVGAGSHVSQPTPRYYVGHQGFRR